MRTIQCVLLSLLLIFSFSLFAVEGTYELERVVDEDAAGGWGGGGGRGGGGEWSTTLTLVKADDGSYSGTFDTGNRSMDLEEVSVDAGKLTFSTTFSWEGRDGMPGGSMETKYEGSVDDDGMLSLTSTAEMMGREMTSEWTGTLMEEEADDEDATDEEATEAPSDEA